MLRENIEISRALIAFLEIKLNASIWIRSIFIYSHLIYFSVYQITFNLLVSS